jgi:lipopolysaccharide export system permease protein
VFRLLHRSIFYELTKVFLLAFVGLTGLLLLAGVIAEATRNGLGPAQILAAIPLLIPSTIPYTVPTTTLFGVCIIYGRLAADNEILALRAAGVHIRHAVWPALALGVLASIVTFVLFLNLIPYTHYILRSQINGDVRELLYGMLKRESRICHARLNYEVYVKRVDGQKLKDAQFRRKNGKGGYDMIAVAREAELLVDMAHNLIYVQMRDCDITDSNNNSTTHVDFRVWPVDIPNDLAGQGKARPSDMTWSELMDARQKIFEDQALVDADIAAHQVAINVGAGEGHYPDHIRGKREERRTLELKLANIDSEVWQRPAFALGCLCFVLVGCPVGIWFSKSDYLSAFITCFLPIVMVYYPLMLCGINMARSGKIPSLAAIGAADALMLFAAIVMYRRLARV